MGWESQADVYGHSFKPLSADNRLLLTILRKWDKQPQWGQVAMSGTASQAEQRGRQAIAFYWLLFRKQDKQFLLDIAFWWLLFRKRNKHFLPAIAFYWPLFRKQDKHFLPNIIFYWPLFRNQDRQFLPTIAFYWPLFRRRDKHFLPDIIFYWPLFKKWDKQFLGGKRLWFAGRGWGRAIESLGVLIAFLWFWAENEINNF
jgi:hypothetical protein